MKPATEDPVTVAVKLPPDRPISTPPGDDLETLAALTSVESPDARRAPRASVPPSLVASPSIQSRVSRPPPPTVGSATAVVAMRTEEAARAHTFGRACAILCVVGLAFQTVMEGVLWLNRTMSAALFVLGGVSVWVWIRSRDPSRYTVRVSRIFCIVGLSASVAFQFYLGIFSPAAVVVAFGLSFFGLSDDRRFVIAMGFLASGIYLTIALLVAFGVIPDLGLFVPREVGLPAKITMMLMVTCVYMVTLWQARLSRRATYEAVERSNDAIRLARQREAQLEEANQNLEGALRAGAGKEGRYTGSMAGRYLLAEVVGRGAMGEVYAASHVDSGARAAVKLLHATVLHNQDLVRRFIREAEVTARLKAPNVIAVYEAGEAADGAPFIAMELLRGHDLSWHLRQRKSLPIEEVAALIRQVALGLDAAHAAGVIHRDLKPQNLLLTDPPKPGRPVWKILDFGVSKLRDSSGTLTEGAVVGTPGYMAPEQAQSRDADHRCDLFALGAVAYRALTGRPPFSGGDTPQILFEIVYRNPTRPSDLAPSIPIAIEQVLAIALAKRPEDRFEAATELSAALESAVHGALDPALERRAEALLAKHPWGRTDRDRP